MAKKKDVAVVKFGNVSRLYGSTNNGGEIVRAVDDVSFEIYPGEYVAITGPSGSGKSTLLHLIGLLDRQTSGDVYIDGVKVTKLNDNQLAKLRNEKIGFVFQQYNLLRRTPAIKNVELPLIYQGVPISRRIQLAREGLVNVGLEDKLNNRPSQLSGGQQQRVAIARALITHPSLLLADEPTGNLDSKSGEGIMSLFDGLHAQGVTIIMVTHENDIAARAKRRIVIKDGKIVCDT
jgi:putative ABC transport system ATP-binding protein